MGELILIYDSGWTDIIGNWVLEESYANWEQYTKKNAENIIRKTETLGLPLWGVGAGWGRVGKRSFDDGEIVMIRRRSFDAAKTGTELTKTRVVMLASSEALWVKFILSVRGVQNDR